MDKPRLARIADRIAIALPARACCWPRAGAGAWWWPTDPAMPSGVAVAVLIVTCPCALSLATPAATLAAAGALARSGVLVRRLQALEACASVDTVVFDKTGTLTEDRMARGRHPHPARASTAPRRLSLAGGAGAALAASGLARDHGRRRRRRAGPPRRSARWRDAACRGGWRRARRCRARAAARLRFVLRCAGRSRRRAGPQVHLADRAGLAGQLRPGRGAAARRRAGHGGAARPGPAPATALGRPRQRPSSGWPRRAGIERARGDCSPEDKLEHVRQAQQRRAIAWPWWATA